MTESGLAFKKEIIRQLTEESSHSYKSIAWTNLCVNIENGSICWEDFQGVKEIINTSEEETSYKGKNKKYGDLRGISFELDNKVNDEPLQFKKVNLAGTNFDYSNLSDLTFEDSQLDEVSFKKSILRETNIIKSQVRWSQFQKSDLFFSNFQDSDLYFSHFEGCDLYQANFEKANLEETRFHLKSAYWRIGLSILILHILKKQDKVNNTNKFLLWLYKKFEKLDKEVSVLEPTKLKGAYFKNAKLDSDPILYRNILDEQYLDKIAKKRKFFYSFWLLTSNPNNS